MITPVGGHIFMRGPYPRNEYDVYVWLGKVFVARGTAWPYAGETRYTLYPVPLLDDNFYLPPASALALPRFTGYRHDQVLTAPSSWWQGEGDSADSIEKYGKGLE